MCKRIKCSHVEHKRCEFPDSKYWWELASFYSIGIRRCVYSCPMRHTSKIKKWLWKWIN